MKRDLNTLAERLYPDKGLREGAEKSCRLIVAIERFVGAEKEYNEALDEARKFNLEHDGNFPGSHLAWKNDILQSSLKDLIDLTFGDLN